MEDDIENKIYFEELLNLCKYVLNDRELFIIKSMYGINTNKLTQIQIASILGCSHQNIGQIIDNSLIKIRKEIKRRNVKFKNKQLGLLTINEINKMR